MILNQRARAPYTIAGLALIACLPQQSVAAGTAAPTWSVVTKSNVSTASVAVKQSGPIELRCKEATPLPVEATFRFRLDEGATVSISATNEQQKPLLLTSFIMGAGNRATIRASAAGQPMATVASSSRNWNARDKRTGAVPYGWRFPRVKNTWDERDRREIGAAYAKLQPFAARQFTTRLVLTSASLQVWVDDRLVAEERNDSTSFGVSATFGYKLTAGAHMESAEFALPSSKPPFLPLSLSNYDHFSSNASQAVAPVRPTAGPPLQLAAGELPDLDLGESLFRYRLSGKSGPFTGYLKGTVAWPTPFEIDPARFAFRVPYRAYQNAWLVVWDDGDREALPRGAFSFYRDETGIEATTEFAVTPDAIKRGLAKPLTTKGPGGRTLYLVQVPLDTAAMQGMRDLQNEFLDFEISKPLHVMRSYPDPIYYGRHPAGRASSLHVAAITLEEAPFDFEVKPKQYAHVFASPENPEYTVRVTNRTMKPLSARVDMTATSYDGSDTKRLMRMVTVPPHAAIETPLQFSLDRYGWYELKTRVAAGEVDRRSNLSLVRLSKDTRTYGMADNETRFGTWMLWGHYMPRLTAATCEPFLAMLRKIGLRRVDAHGYFIDPAIAKKYDFLPNGPHTNTRVFHRLDVNDPAAVAKMVDDELASMAPVAAWWPGATYFYGGEFGISKEIQYAPDPRHTGDGPRELTAEETARVERQIKMFSAIGTAMRKKHPDVKLALQWGAPLGTTAFMRLGFPKELVDYYGMDQPEFELMPELSNLAGTLNGLWALRQEAARLKYPQHPISWCEGQFLPTNLGALTEREQADYQIRNWLVAFAYGVDIFEAGVVPFDAGNYYGAEHYGAGVFHRTPFENPKPAVAAIATAATMLNGADPIGGVNTGSLTTYCMGFERKRAAEESVGREKVYALWRIRGTAEAQVTVQARGPVTLTDSMGNATQVRNGAVTLRLGTTPVWLSGVMTITGFQVFSPVYSEIPAAITRPLGTFTAVNWKYDGAGDSHYANNHFAARRITDTNLTVAFNADEPGHKDAIAVTLPVEPTDRPLGTRYGALAASKQIPIPGRAQALGLWVKGNASWGRIVYQLRDANGEIWTALGTANDWNCDDPYGRSYVNFEGWRYVRFPLPGNHTFDRSRESESTWWGSRGGDGIVDLPLAIDRIFVEARNEAPYLGEMKLVAQRSYKLSELRAEYATAFDATNDAVAEYNRAMPLPEWSGPAENPIANLAQTATAAAPTIREFVEPPQFNDGRRMHIRFEAAAGLKYNLYLSLYPDGRGAELVKADVKDNELVTGFVPDKPLYLFLTSVDAQKNESRPSEAFKLVTHDNFAEK